MKKIKVTVTAIDPLIITSSGGDSVLTSSANFISGTMLRGLFAGKYIKEKKLGTEAHKDASFRKLFFGSLNFIDAMPAHNDQPAFHVPFSLMKHKTTGEIQDLLVNGEPRPGFKNIRGLAVMADDSLCNIYVDKNISFHMSRSSEEERIAGRSVDGQVFSYESIASGQVFVGEIIGEDDDLQELLNALPQKDFAGRVGRSRFTQYGAVKVHLGDIEDVQKVSISKDNKVFVYAISPLIPPTGNISSAETALEELGFNNISDAKITNVFSSVVSIDNFVNIWGMKRPRVQALAAGTVFAIEKNQWSDEDLQQLEQTLYQGVGQRTQEGFGQLRIWSGNVKAIGKEVNCFAAGAGSGKLKAGLARDVVQRIVKKYVLEELKQFAYADAVGMKSYMDESPHFFARLLQELGNSNLAEDKRQMLANKVMANLEERKNSPYYKAMKGLSVNNATFEDLLKDTSATMPYVEAWHKSLQKESGKLGELMEKIEMNISDTEISNGEYFHTYWYWLFRYCRKFAAAKKGGR